MPSRLLKCCTCVGVLVAALCPSAADAQTVVTRERLGNNTEGISFFPRGRRENVAIIDGYDVFSVGLSAAGSACDPSRRVRQNCRRLFSVRFVGDVAPRGIAYVPGQERFYFGAIDGTLLHVTDVDGTVLAPLQIQHLTDPATISQWEGLAYIPPDSLCFPNTIAGITIHDGVGHVQIIRFDGVVVREIVFPAGSALSSHLGGIAYRAPDRLLLTSSAGGNVIYETTCDGSVVTPVATAAGASVLEGLTTTDSGQVVAADYGSGRLFVFDDAFGRRPDADRTYVVGLGISAAGSKIAWNPETREFLVTTSPSGDRAARILAVSQNLGRFREVVDLAGTQFSSLNIRGLGYLPGENLAVITIASTGPRGVAFFDTNTGSFVSLIQLNVPFPIPGDVTPLPGDLLALRVSGRPQEIQVITRTGMALPPIVLSAPPTDGGLAFYRAPAGDQIFVGLSSYDLNGELLARIPKAALGVAFINGIAPITDRRPEETFAVIEPQTSEVVIFSLP